MSDKRSIKISEQEYEPGHFVIARVSHHTKRGLYVLHVEHVEKQGDAEIWSLFGGEREVIVEGQRFSRAALENIATDLREKHMAHVESQMAQVRERVRAQRRVR